MQIGTVMATSNGPHSAGKWALVTVGEIMWSVFGVRNAQTVSQRKLELALLDGLEHHHGKVVDHERGQLAAVGHERLTHPLDPTPHLEDVVNDLIADCQNVGPIETSRAADDPEIGTRMVDVAAHLARPEVREQLRLLIGRHFATSMDIERSWHADRNPDHPTVKAWKHSRHEHGGAHAHHHAKEVYDSHAAAN